jgi:hypothetical protein
MLVLVAKEMVDLILGDVETVSRRALLCDTIAHNSAFSNEWILDCLGIFFAAATATARQPTTFNVKVASRRP